MHYVYAIREETQDWLPFLNLKVVFIFTAYGKVQIFSFLEITQNYL